jgi:hypothetical protein
MNGPWRLHLRALALAASTWLIATPLPPADCSAQEPARSGRPAWLDRTQTYCMVPVLPETAAELHASVNGVWAGISGPSPVLTSRDIVPAVAARYGAHPEAFVDACRRAGLVVTGVVNGLEGFPALRAGTPDLDSMACRDARGKPASVGSGSKGMMLMCTNNPAWLRWEIDQGKRGIELGAELVLVDTPMSSSFVSGFLKAGFCGHCMAAFERHLRARFTPRQLEERLGLAAFDAKAVVARLAPLQDIADPGRRPHHNTGRDDLLFREFIRCQEQASFDTRKQLVDALRAHASAKGRAVAFCTNASDLGTANPGGHWVRALMFADLFDLFAYELNVEPMGMMSNEVLKYPRGKWAAYHKLAQAVHHRRAPAVIHAGAMGRLITDVMSKRRSVNTWMEVQSAEAYAANGAYIQYDIEPLAGNRLFLDRCWAGSARHAAFVRSHADLYDGDLRSGSSLAVVFLMNERGRTIPAVYPSYLGFTQALVEGNYPFDVLFAGDGHYVQDRLAGDQLQPYTTLLVPSPIEPTDRQKRVIQDFVSAGGTLVCQEPERLGLCPGASSLRLLTTSCLESEFGHGKGKVLRLRGSVSATWTDDAGSNFFKSYQPGLREEIGQLARSLGLAPVLRRETSGLVSVFPVAQPGKRRLVLHLVNYDIDYERDRIREKADVEFDLARPGFLPDRVTAHLLIPDGPERTLNVSDSKGRLSFTLLPLGVCATVVISGR